MISVFLSPPCRNGRTVRRSHAFQDAHRLLIGRQRLAPSLPIPNLVVSDDIAVLATAEFGDSYLSGADSLDTGDASHSKFRRSQISNFLHKVHSDPTPGHTSDRSVFESWFSSGLCHSRVILLLLSSEKELTLQPSATESSGLPSLPWGPEARRRLLHTKPTIVVPGSTEVAAATISSSAGDSERGSAERRRHDKPLALALWEKSGPFVRLDLKRAAAVFHFDFLLADMTPCRSADRRRHQDGATRTRAAAAVISRPAFSLSSRSGRNLAGGRYFAKRAPPAFSPFHTRGINQSRGANAALTRREGTTTNA